MLDSIAPAAVLESAHCDFPHGLLEFRNPGAFIKTIMLFRPKRSHPARISLAHPAIDAIRYTSGAWVA
jgi:hypothetical protein